MENASAESIPAHTMITNIVRELFTCDFWLTGLAMVKYVPRSFRVPPVNGIVFFTEAKHKEFRNRVLAIRPDNPRQWGTMSVAQMLHHLNLACGGPFGFYRLPDESYITARTVFRWILIDWFPEQPVGLRLPKNFKIPHDAQFDFDFEKQQLVSILDKAWQATSPSDWGPHPMFGKMSPKEWGKLFQIHIDYHLKQFGA
jgi:hypothetical protein